MEDVPASGGELTIWLNAFGDLWVRDRSGYDLVFVDLFETDSQKHVTPKIILQRAVAVSEWPQLRAMIDAIVEWQRDPNADGPVKRAIDALSAKGESDVH